MNADLAAIAEKEGDRCRAMPEPPAAYHDHGGGKVEEVPLVHRAFLLTCGVEALYIVLQQMDAPERFAATTKETLADLILEKTRGTTPPAEMLPRRVIPARSLTARARRFQRNAKRQVKDALREARTHGVN